MFQYRYMPQGTASVDDKDETTQVSAQALREGSNQNAKFKIIGKDSDYISREEIEASLAYSGPSSGSGTDSHVFVRVTVPVNNCDTDKYTVFISPTQYMKTDGPDASNKDPNFSPAEDPWSWSGPDHNNGEISEVEPKMWDKKGVLIAERIQKNIPQKFQIHGLDPILYEKTNKLFTLIAYVPLPYNKNMPHTTNKNGKPIAFQINFGFLRTDE